MISTKLRTNLLSLLSRQAWQKAMATSMQDKKEFILTNPSCHLSQGCDITIKNFILSLFYFFKKLVIMACCLYVPVHSTYRGQNKAGDRGTGVPAKMWILERECEAIVTTQCSAPLKHLSNASFLFKIYFHKLLIKRYYITFPLYLFMPSQMKPFQFLPC